MNRILTVFAAMFLALPTAAAGLLISFFAFEQTFLLSIAISLILGVSAFFLSAAVFKIRYLRKHGLTRKEYQYIEKNLDEAKRKIFRLNKALVMIRHIPSIRQRIDLIRITRKIYSLTKKEPKRFYLANEFYFSHLDSAVELTERYNFLSAQPIKNAEIEHSLLETRRTIDELSHSIEKDLYQILSEDVNQLQFELDVAKHTIKTAHDTP
ncbi:5-bromo-4-chloroindolyl phosphate hydrolysis protein [Peribacillus deserti]|uniref:5-bromo-4-chloroindolyl phosphate hydrolysis protein n=1 Tax=Peribacillus deserti TaxID=673318 RepID=A0ABS2QMD4_9BACI|nr:5-bromo-4-chloroindolyl phosphate hydrolysis family protein [Peribacillus deserti]MBM7693623.1 5-bromo-4-chloroindolyl phosphate hydrolysis protein [Peribacillus deserti]